MLAQQFAEAARQLTRSSVDVGTLPAEPSSRSKAPMAPMLNVTRAHQVVVLDALGQNAKALQTSVKHCEVRAARYRRHLRTGDNERSHHRPAARAYDGCLQARDGRPPTLGGLHRLLPAGVGAGREARLADVLGSTQPRRSRRCTGPEVCRSRTTIGFDTALHDLVDLAGDLPFRPARPVMIPPHDPRPRLLPRPLPPRSARPLPAVPGRARRRSRSRFSPSVTSSASSNARSVDRASSPPTACCSAPSAASFLARPGGPSWSARRPCWAGPNWADLTAS
jgi:hypothetical protein